MKTLDRDALSQDGDGNDIPYDYSPPPTLRPELTRELELIWARIKMLEEKVYGDHK